MSNHVTPETAKKLKDAGFPQPTVGIGQVWHDPPNRAIFVGEETAMWVAEREKTIFCPFATDILKELGENYCLHINEQWACECFSDSEMYIQDNPAEACALAWLAIHETKV